MTEETQDAYVRETYRGCPMVIEASVLDEMAQRGLDGMQLLRNKIDDVMDTTRTFSEALYELKAGQKMRRQVWARNKFVYIVEGSEFTVSRPPLNKLFTDGRTIRYATHIDVFEGENDAAVWHATNADLLADDWHIHG